MPGPGADDLQRASTIGSGQAEIQLGLTSCDPLGSDRPQRRQLASSCAEPRCSICRERRREDHTTCTAIAPDVVRTVRTYATSAGYGHRLVRKSSPLRPLQPSKHGSPAHRTPNREPSRDGRDQRRYTRRHGTRSGHHDGVENLHDHQRAPCRTASTPSPACHPTTRPRSRPCRGPAVPPPSVQFQCCSAVAQWGSCDRTLLKALRLLARSRNRARARVALSILRVEMPARSQPDRVGQTPSYPVSGQVPPHGTRCQLRT